MKYVFPNRAPSLKRLEEAFPGHGGELRKLCQSPEYALTYSSVKEWLARCFNRPFRCELTMCAINQELGGYGTETLIRTGRWPDMTYINLGDTYATTIILDHISMTFKIQSLGDWVEIAERRGRKYP